MPWIKIQTNLIDVPEVSAIGMRLRIAPAHVVGCLVAVWSWADALTDDGLVQHATAELIDRKAGKKGFAEAMTGVGWLRIELSGVVLPKWDRHNGESAKARAGEAEAKRLSRAGVRRSGPVTVSAPPPVDESGQLSGQVSGQNGDRCRDQRRGEERREEDIQSRSSPPPPPAERLNAVDVDSIYAAYPRKVGKADALKAIAKALKTKPAAELLAAVNAYAVAMADWPEGERQFIPHPATWFNGGRYDDDPATWVRCNATKNQPRPLSTDMTHEELTKRHGGTF